MVIRDVAVVIMAGSSSLPGSFSDIWILWLVEALVPDEFFTHGSTGLALFAKWLAYVKESTKFPFCKIDKRKKTAIIPKIAIYVTRTSTLHNECSSVLLPVLSVFITVIKCLCVIFFVIFSLLLVFWVVFVNFFLSNFGSLFHVYHQYDVNQTSHAPTCQRCDPKPNVSN